LINLIQDPGDTKRTWQPVLDTPEVPKDAWGHDFEYSVDQQAKTFTLVSGGPDGSIGGADDIKVTHRF
jgi:hypothetical protein